MPRRFVSEFLLPLLRGGALHVGRPLGPGAVARLAAALPHGAPDVSVASAVASPVAALGAARRAVAARYLPDTAAPPLDEASLRLGAALHDLLVLGHPGLKGTGPAGLAHRQDRIAEAAFGLADVGAPPSAREAVNRHSLLSRVPEILRVDRTVSFWLGRRHFVGRTPPRRVTAWPRLRRVKVERSSRGWLREIGIPAAGRRAFLALNLASPLGEALDPLRLDPPVGWGRILPVLRFPPLARLVAGAAVETGIERVGDALAGALFRFARFHDPPVGVVASPEALAFALRFLAHVVWLDVLFGAAALSVGQRGAPAEPPARPARSGIELAVVLTAAARLQRSLVWPADVPADGDLGRAFAARLGALGAQAEGGDAARLAAARSIAELATAGAPAAEPLAL